MVASSAASRKSAKARAQRATSQDPELSEAAARVLRRFRLVFNAVKTHFRQVERKVGVGGAQLWALSVVRASPGMGMSELARTMDIHQSTASNLVRSLVDLGLVAIDKNPQDRRQVQLRPLPAGARVLRRAPAPFSGVLPQALRSLDAETLARLEMDLGQLIAALKVDERSAGIPIGSTDTVKEERRRGDADRRRGGRSGTQR